MRTLSQIRATGTNGLLVAFGRQEDAPEETWCMLFDPASLATIARSGQEVVFTARESEAPTFNPHLHWVITLLFVTELAAEKAEVRLRALMPEDSFRAGI